MANNEVGGEKGSVENTTLARKIGRYFAAVSLAALAFVVVFSYWNARQTVLAEAQSKLRLTNGIVKAMRTTVQKELRPVFLKKGIFHPSHVVSSATMIAAVGRHLQSDPEFSRYLIRYVSDNPTNQSNYPSEGEMLVLKHLRKTGKSEITKVVKFPEGPYLVHAKPLVAKSGCLSCHGDPAAAPKEIVAFYGRESGYHYRIGEIVGAAIVGIPFSEITPLLIKQAVLLSLIMVAVLGLAFYLINRFVQQEVALPIVRLTEVAKALSKGAVDRPLRTSRSDEIGALVRAIELLRRSIQVAIRRMKG